ncbi:MAG: hypothetical protein GC151_10060 [Betaproteobacteria bacterium]|nr:hypothetical protein [Betaproteobacteria bacterium]
MTPPRSVPVIALTVLHRRTLFVVGGLLVLTGIGWLVCHFLLPGDPDFPEMPHPFEPFWMKLHGACAMAALVGVGSVIPWHAWRAWQMRRNRTSGLWMAVILGVLVLTGWALYYVGSEFWRPYYSAVHWVVGLLVVPVMWLHVILGKRARVAGRART